MISKNTKISSKLATLMVLVLTTGFLSGCAAGKTAPTRLIKQVTDGVEGESGEIKLRNIVVIARDTSTVVLVGTLVNQGDSADSLTSITIGNNDQFVQRVDYPLQKNSPIIFEGPSANARLVLNNFAATAGDRIRVRFGFVNAAAVELSALVVAADGIYKDAGITPLSTNLNQAP